VKGERDMLLDVIAVKATSDYQLIVTFEDNQQRHFDMEPYINQPPWNRLQEEQIFTQVHVENGTVVWPGNIDIDPETLYEYSRSVAQQAEA